MKRKLLLATIFSVAFITAFQAKALTINNDSNEKIKVRIDCDSGRYTNDFIIWAHGSRRIEYNCCRLYITDSRGKVIIDNREVCNTVSITKSRGKWYVSKSK
jgi:hypothetical protein